MQLRVFIENAAGSLVKHIHDEKTLELRGTEAVSRPYPYPYGFILETTAEDGDNVDCFILTKSTLRRADIVECEAVGLMEQVEDGEIDHKILALISSENPPLESDYMPVLTDFCRHVFDHMPGKKMRIGEFRDVKEALRYIAQHRDSMSRLSTNQNQGS
jgi:inorganic pyrophosphatase